MTALAVPPAAANVPTPPPVGRLIPQPLAVVFADLLPDEVKAKRRVRYLKKRLIFALIAMVLLVGLGDALVRQQTSTAQGDLASANAQIAAYNGQLAKFTPVLTTQSEIAAIRTQLSGAMVNDVSWPSLIAVLAHNAPRGLLLISMAGQVDDPSSTGATPDPTTGLTTSTDPVVGSLTLSGTAPDYSSIASYVVALAGVKGFTAVNPATVTNASTGHQLMFTLTLSLTSGILTGHYTPATAPGGTPAAGGTATGSTAPAAGTTTTVPGADRLPSTKHLNTAGPAKTAKHKSTAPAIPPLGD